MVGIQRLSSEDVEALQSLQTSFKKCVSANGLGLQALTGKDSCQVIMNFPSDTVFLVIMNFPSDTVPMWKDLTTGELEGLSFEFNLCEAVATWEQPAVTDCQVQNSTAILTREYIGALQNGWEDYAWHRINKGVNINCCENKTVFMEKLSLVLPEVPPYLLKTKFGKEIDNYDAVLRENGAPIQNFTESVGHKSTFRLLYLGSAKAIDKVIELVGKKEVLLIKTTIHDIMSKMIRVHHLGSAAKGTGLKALEFAHCVCEKVDMYGFTVDPGYKEWTRYFSESRKGHTPLLGRAYYQMMKCLGLIKIHSPMRADPKRLPWRHYFELSVMTMRIGVGSEDSLRACSIRQKRAIRKISTVCSSRKPAFDHQKFVKRTTIYPLEQSPGHGLLCALPND
ncbi:hypothetical protein K2173_005440 [Erythroxylum novogranatense]|uniref:Uncharacterized protein n=1 Tax=Erythroxylum novogranatense TaxID=1862640 RepID=A0AAV8SKM9_9ROSI|nr:hypothetical protein K2173_005440 [Erythroxylum novogranatense]